MARSKGPPQENEQALRARILAGSEKLEDYNALADLLLDSPGREEEGLAVLERALDLPLPDVQRARICAEVAWYLYELRQTERATAMARRALSHITEETQSAEVLMIRGLSHATLAFSHYAGDRVFGDREASLALEPLEQILTHHPDFEYFADACRHAAGVYVLRENYPKAVALCEEAMRRDNSERNRLDCLVCLGNALRFLGRHAEGEARLREALELTEVDQRYLPRIYFEFGKVQRLTNRPEEALMAFERALAALDLSPFLRGDRNFLAEIKWELGNSYYDASRYGEAIATFSEVLPDLLETYAYLHYDTLVCLGHCYLVTGQYAKARDAYEEVLASEGAGNEERAAAQEGLSSLPPLPPPRVH